MKNKLQKIAPEWHAEAATLLNENFGKIHAAFQDATKRAVWMGMFLNHIKAKGKEDGSIPHGKFLQWIETNVPGVPFRTAQTYMNLAVGVCEKGNFEIRQFSVFADLPGHLPPKIERAIDGQTQQQLFLSFKNVDADGNPLKPGCAPGKRGLSDDEKAALADPLLEIENDLVSITDENDTTFADVMSARLAKFSQALKACHDRAEAILKSRRAK